MTPRSSIRTDEDPMIARSVLVLALTRSSRDAFDIGVGTQGELSPPAGIESL